MSRLPQISTPGRPSPTSGFSTPGARRPRSSLGPGHTVPSTSEDAMDKALQDALRTRPPSSLRNLESPSELSESTSYLSAPFTLQAPRTPGMRPRTPSSLGVGASATPSAGSRSISRAGLGVRSGLATSTTAPFTPRRTSMASSTSTTPFARRPESRASERDSGSAKWMPVVGEKVRINSMGYEGVLRYYGPTQFKEGVWAGVELEGGFKGKGKNDGSVEGVHYFSCPPQCGIFVTAVKLSQPTAGISRPSSVASSHRSTASYSVSGRATPSISGRATPSRPPSSTPGRATRTVSSAVRVRPGISGFDEDLPTRTTLGNSTSANAGPDSRYTAGSRASRYAGMTAKQLDSARAGTTSKLGVSTSTVMGVTPKSSRVSMGFGTPARGPRQSMGTSLVTPRARVPRPSGMDMPPPPSPGNINKVVSARQVEALDEEIRELKRRNGELEEELRRAPELRDDAALDEIRQQEAERVQRDLDSLRSQLERAENNATDAVKVLEEIQQEHTAQSTNLEERLQEISELRKELKLASDRSEQELAAGADARRDEVGKMQERAEAAELEAGEMKALVDELTNAGQQMIQLNETKQYELEERVRELEGKNKLLDEKLQKAREEHEKSLLPPSPSARQREATTAAEIDNETLNAQVKHLQNKINHIEEELDEARAQAESDAEAWKNRLNRAKDGEKVVREETGNLKAEIKDLKDQANGARNRVGELEGALKENQIALEGARAEIENLRTEAAEAATMRSALQSAAANEKVLAAAQEEMTRLKGEIVALQQAGDQASSASSSQVRDLKTKIVSLEAEVASLTSKISSSNAASSDDAEKKIRGFQHIIQELHAENADLKEQCESLREEVGLLKEEIKLLEETAGDGPSEKGQADQKELLEAKATIKELNREVAELETLIETKIYREDELETRATSLEQEVERYRKSATSHLSDPPPSASSSKLSHGSDGHSSRSTSTATAGTKGDSEDRCELCEGPHDLDACPVFAGNVTGEDGRKTGSGTWCADCESNEHDTAECPMAEDVF